MDLNARVDLNCGWKDGQTDGRTENGTPISHLAKAGATMRNIKRANHLKHCRTIRTAKTLWHFGCSGSNYRVQEIGYITDLKAVVQLLFVCMWMGKAAANYR